MDLLTTNEMSKKCNISRRRIATLCKDGRIPGSIIKGKTWLIPKDAPKPMTHVVPLRTMRIQKHKISNTNKGF